MRSTSPPSSVANPTNTKTGSSVFPTPRYRFNPPAGYASVAVNRASISGYALTMANSATLPPDGQRERHDGRPGEPFVPANQAEPVRHILLELRRKSRQATLTVDATVQLDERVACAADVAELAQGLFPRCGRIEALRLEGTRAHLQMKPHLVPHVVTHFAYGLRGEPEQSSNA
jgi:hypothetical protein